MSWISNPWIGASVGTVIYSRRRRRYRRLRRVGVGVSDCRWAHIDRNILSPQERRDARSRARLWEAFRELGNLGGEMADEDRRQAQQAQQARREGTQNSRTTSSGRVLNPSSRNPRIQAALARIRRRR